MNLHSLYTASCQREVGIILNVSSQQVFLLNLQGTIVTLPRYEIIYFATYPLDIVPMGKVSNPELVPIIEIKTWRQNQLQPLVRGWPVDFSQDKISFLSLRGSEVVIDRSSIWGVESDRSAKAQEFSARPSNSYDFVHPYAFADCPVAKTDGNRPVKVFPQQLLSDPVAIKREFDRLVQGHEVVRKYESDQQFYPVPEVYGNATSLGLWTSAGSRYGASGNRKNNFTPLLTNDFSSGPFGFQSHFETGSGPMLFSLHEEAQTQVYYRMKADYFHFSAMLDPNLILVGKRYKWLAPDLDGQDARANDSAFLEFGFDYGALALELGIGGATNAAGRDGDLFAMKTINLPRFGFRYQKPNWNLHVFAGSGSKDDSSLELLRANFEFNNGKDQRYVVSLIKRDIKIDSASGPETNYARVRVNSEAQTAAAYAYFRYRTRYWFGVSGSAESNEITATNGQSKKHIYPKGGVFLSLGF